MWKLIQVTDTEWIPDNSGHYTLINYIDENTVRLDYMDRDDNPLVSYQGTAENVRKHAVRDHELFLSHEHASYIGRELARAELLKTDYVQD